MELLPLCVEIDLHELLDRVGYVRVKLRICQKVLTAVKNSREYHLQGYLNLEGILRGHGVEPVLTMPL